ncbi:MAG TPA: MBG domain-containing protein, partial [Flavisolibacter sp.]|nr:MBG domain-containing protein [Flavisolibacter sp.]
MTKFLLSCMLALVAGITHAQTTYYWVGGASSGTVNTGANWNTAINGTGSSRPSSSGATDVLVFDGANLGGASTVTGPATINLNASITCGQMKFVNNAQISFIRGTGGTSTINISGGSGEDFVIESGSSLSLVSTVGSTVIAMAATTTGRVSGNMAMITNWQARIANTTGGSPGSLVFTSGSNFRTNITAGSAAYAFGNASQSSEKWVVFEAGSHLYYEGGYSPMGSSSTFMPIDFKAGSFWHHKANNPATGFGTFFNRKSFANIIVENNATLAADGSIFRIDTLTINPGSSFVTHSSGETVVLGPISVFGDLTSDPASTNELVLAGNDPQTISGGGTVNIPGLVVANNAQLLLEKNINVHRSASIFGKINFDNFQLTGAGNFRAAGQRSAIAATGNLVAGSYMITGNTGIPSGSVGFGITGTGIAPNTAVVSVSSTGDSVFLSKPVLASGSAVALSASTDGSTLETAGVNGFENASGSVALTGSKNFENGISYIINASTSHPFGISTGSTAGFIRAANVRFNNAVTTNTSAHISGNLHLGSGRATIRSSDTVHLLSGATLTGSFGSTSYFVTSADVATGAQGVFRFDGVSGSQVLPIGTAGQYLPATVNPGTASDFAASVFEGITANGLPNGTPLTASEKLTKVNAVWSIERVNGTGNSNLELAWTQALEGTAFSTFLNADIGIITNQNPGWSLPVTAGDNTLNSAAGIVSSFGRFGIGAKPPTDPFTFNPLVSKTYGDPDFNPGAISLNTAQPIVYTSSNPAVATIVANQVHITGTGTTDITASQASDGFYDAVSVTQSLTVAKAPLTIRADDKLKPQGDPNPALTLTYTGFVYGENASVLTTPVNISTTAVTASPAGTYPIVVSGGAAANYTITLVNGTMTVTPRQPQTITFNALSSRTYGSADFSSGVSSSNNTIPVVLTSSNPAVATIVGTNIRIVGAGTTTITASQAGNDLFFPAPSVARTLTVNKANLTVRVRDTVKTVGEPNPPFQITYSGFVLGQNAGNLPTQPVATTTATTSTPPGYYPIELSGGVSSNYNFIYNNGRLTILPLT